VQTTPLSINETNNSSTITPKPPRPRFSPQERQAILQRYHATELRQAEFVAQEAISKASLSRWLQKEKRQPKAKVPKPRFQEVLVPQARSPWQVEIVSPQNWSVRFSAVPSSSALEPLLRSLPC